MYTPPEDYFPEGFDYWLTFPREKGSQGEEVFTSPYDVQQELDGLGNDPNYVVVFEGSSIYIFFDAMMTIAEIKKVADKMEDYVTGGLL